MESCFIALTEGESVVTALAALKTEPGDLTILLRHYAASPRHHEIAGLLRDAVQAIEAHADPEPLNVKEVATLLGMKETWVREQVRTDSLPYFRHGKYVVFDRSEILGWRHSMRQGPKPGRRRD